MPILVICVCITHLWLHWLDNINLFDHFWIQMYMWRCTHYICSIGFL